MKKKTLVVLVSSMYLSLAVCAQNSLSISTQMLWSKVEVKDNWTPATAPHYQEYRSGSAFGYGVNLNYSFQPKFLIKDKNFWAYFGVGYFGQKFNINRPFDYYSHVDMIFYTDSYTYHCGQLTAGVHYNYPIGKFSLIGNISYSQFYSFSQKYTPTRKDFATQKNRKKIDFGKMLGVGIGVNRNLGERFSAGMLIIAPVYTRWRNDSVFGDDPTTDFQPKSGLGISLGVAFLLNEKRKTKIIETL